jgi:peptidoglycan hydrolase-like protein with peptidoglycan-binding domain
VKETKSIMRTNTINSNSVTFNAATSVNPETTAFPYTTHLPELKKGKAGEAVRFLQKFLICQGYTYLVFDGQFGHLTEQAVMDFQYNYNYLGKSNPDYLIVDGVVGKDTWRAISNLFCY